MTIHAPDPDKMLVVCRLPYSVSAMCVCGDDDCYHAGQIPYFTHIPSRNLSRNEVPS